MNTFLSYIISKLNTKQSRTGSVEGFKHFRITQELFDTCGRNDIRSTLQMLEQRLPKDVFEVQWKTYGLNCTPTGFRILRSSIDSLFEIAGMDNPKNELEKARCEIEVGLVGCQTEWLKAYYRDLLDTVGRGTIPGDLQYCDLFRILNLIAANQADVYMRAFSVRYLQDSKTFERVYKKRTAGICRRYCPDLIDDAEDTLSDNDVLRYFGILTYSNYLEFKGPLQFSLDDCEVSAAPYVYGMVLNTETILRMHVLPSPAIKQIITLENKANYYAAPYKPDTLYIYVHGNLSPAERKVCKQIALSLPECQYRHWGDLDYGGIQIYLSLKRRVFPSIQPYLMDAQTYLRFQQSDRPGIPLSSATLGKLARIQAEELAPLQQMLLSHKTSYEQEGIIADGNFENLYAKEIIS